MSLRPVVIFLGILGLLSAGYLMLPGPKEQLKLPERAVDGPLFAIAIAVVSILLFVAAREPRTTSG